MSKNDLVLGELMSAMAKQDLIRLEISFDDGKVEYRFRNMQSNKLNPNFIQVWGNDVLYWSDFNEEYVLMSADDLTSIIYLELV